MPRRPSPSARPHAALLLTGLLAIAGRADAASILFIGNSFTYGQGSAVHYYRANTVTDLNGQGIGGMPALFKSFATEAGLDYDVYLETQGGVGIDWHLANKSAVVGSRPWDSVVMHGYSTLDAAKPGDPGVLIESVKRMSALLRARNPGVEIRLMSTWPRADQTYDAKGAWYGKPIEAMAHDLRSGYDKAVAATPGIKPVIPVGDAWIRAIQSGVADENPYDGVAAGKLDLWTYDHYHASNYGYYLETLVVFGSVTGHDPRSLGDGECSGYELGLSRPQVAALEQIAFDQLAATGPIKPAPARPSKAGAPEHCAPAR